MFGCFFKMDNGLTHHPGKDFGSEAEAVHYAEQSLEVSPNYASAVVTHKLFPILVVEG
jgi:hypothetical protein